MKRYVVLEKRVGETPLQAIGAWRAAHPEYRDTRASYAGRLDPMASGKLLVLIGDECKRQGAYTNLDKEYEIEVLLDIGTDTGDVLGLCNEGGEETHSGRTDLTSVLKKLEGAHRVAYPVFSSKTVDGKPLFLHALLGTLGSISLPEHIEHIYRIRVCDMRTLPVEELKRRIETQLSRAPRTTEPSKMLGADFRIREIRSEWATLFGRVGAREFTLATLRVSCGSGTYMRTLAARIGTALGTRALALSIKRTRIGKYVPVLGGHGVWLYEYR